jgi:hypothetical protein
MSLLPPTCKRSGKSSVRIFRRWYSALNVLLFGSASRKWNSTGFHAMFTLTFGPWIVCFGLSGGSSSTRNLIYSWSVERQKHGLSRVIMNCQPWCSMDQSWGKSSNERVARSAFWVGVKVWGTQRRCFTTKPNDYVKRRWTVTVGIQVKRASSWIEQNEYYSRASRIVWLITTATYSSRSSTRIEVNCLWRR